MSDVFFRLEIWRPARPERHFIYENHGDNGRFADQLLQERLHEQAYSWRLEGDVWTSLENDEAGQKIREQLSSSFMCSLPPQQRGFDKLKGILVEIKSYLSNEEKRKWQSWQQLINDDDPDNTYQAQPLLSLYHHLRWLCDVFQDIPGASVTIR